MVYEERIIDAHRFELQRFYYYYFFYLRILSVSLRLDSFIKAFLELLFDFKQWQASTF